MAGLGASDQMPSTLLRVLATTDLHCNLLSYDYFADRNDPGVGLSRVAAYIEKARQEVQVLGGATILLDNGDSLQGAPIGEIGLNDVPQIEQGRKPCEPHPVMKAFTALDYDAIGLGNHDFNFGLEKLGQVLADAPCPVLCSNMRPVGHDQVLPFLHTTILERGFAGHPKLPTLRIGLLSVLPPQTLKWDAHLLEGRVWIEDMVQSAAHRASELKSAGCDLVIALAHTGAGGEEAVPNMENALLPIVATSGIDAVVAGHTHLVLPDPATPLPKPVVMPGAHGSHLGQIDLNLEFDQAGWQLADWQAKVIPISRRSEAGKLGSLVEEDTGLVELLAEPHEETRRRMQKPVGHSSVALHSFFTLFGRDQGLAMVGQAQLEAVRSLLAGTEAGDLPLISAVSPGKFGGRSGPESYTDIEAGELCLRNIADLQIFPNELWAVVVDGAHLLDWLEMSAGLFNQIQPGQTGRDLVNSDRAGHNFDVLFGLEYEIDVTQPPRFSASGLLINAEAHRIHNLRCNGIEVTSDQRFVVATSSYRVSGGGNFRMAQEAERLPLPKLRIREAVCDFAAGHPPERQMPYPWAFSAGVDANVFVYSSPTARKYLHELSELQFEELGVTPGGFLQLQICL
ncbi:2`,3`-cyclic-nucleotide 2`-phosphodiesterase, putative [Roseobacter sp. SK209-2-6]|uniref:5'-nucleotidase C-terminal domain-containing protein n=1 Tax=Roseobacter sp. SK209-2-6 TaxID=388739 RepID=UPI0000F3CE15|nr:5'-nucleotidase C-terminal domain-containing protein [Roseobacter sp. SK209-2-6]EBA15908.1 2`,3`-cyclic-nucleotide 2`-phosphodiesterase, putative [Roseobacter sp. SK209-2-6]